MDKRLIINLISYIEKAEATLMWEYSSNILEDEELFKDKDRMPHIYFELKKLIKTPTK